jgi:hypothetical protein
MKSASVYERDSRVIVHSQSRTTSGYSLLDDPVLRVNGDDAALGEAVRRCLDASKVGVVDAQNADLFRPVLALAGVRSWKAFMDGARHAHIQVDGNGAIGCGPSHNGGARDGFFPLPQLSLHISASASDAELGAAVRAALGRSS